MDNSDLREFKQEKLPSNRSFGLTFTVIFLIFAVVCEAKNLENRALLSFLIAGIFFVLALFCEGLLSVPNRLWNKLGKALAKFMNPIVLGLIFFLVVTPAGIVLRKLKLLDYKSEFKSSEESYWIHRDQESQTKERVELQF